MNNQNDYSLNDLLLLLRRQIFKYTSGESSSVRIETAKMLLESILYSIDYAKRNCLMDKNILYTGTTCEVLFQQGIECIKKSLEEAKNLLMELQKNSLDFGNTAYEDTIFKGIGMFFRDYDFRFAAQETPGSIDYPLALPLEGLQGIEYIRDYLVRITLENNFCHRFKESDLTSLLRGWHTDCSEMLVNLFEMVLHNVLGNLIIGEKIDRLTLTEEDRKKLFLCLGTCTQEELFKKLKDAACELCSQCKMEDSYENEYIMKSAKLFAYSVWQNLKLDKLDTIFITCKEEEDKEIQSFQDGASIEDDKLRVIITEIIDCKSVSDKIELLKFNIHSLQDLKEILNVCFWKGEFSEVFDLLSKEELHALRIEIEEDYTYYSDFLYLSEWKKALIGYTEK